MLKRYVLLSLSLFLLTVACGNTREIAPELPLTMEPDLSPEERRATVGASVVAPSPESPADFPAWEVQGVRTAYSRAGTYILKWKPVGGKVPKNEHFELDLWLFRADQPLKLFTDALIATRGWMPKHGHGMVRQPRSVQQEDGHYRINGMLLHMAGYWQIFFDVVVDGQSESTQFDLTL